MKEPRRRQTIQELQRLTSELTAWKRNRIDDFGELPGAAREGHKSSLDLYGFVMLDSGRDFGQNGSAAV